MRKWIAAALISIAFSCFCSAQRTIGISLPDAGSPRWPRERDAMVEILKAAGFEALVEEAGYDARLQSDQMRDMAAKGAKVLIVVAEDGEYLAPVVDELSSRGVKVIAYDRFIPTASIAAYVSFDFFEIGRMQARGILESLGRPPKGRIFLLGGSPTDVSAFRLRIGQMEVLKPFIDQGGLRVVADQWAANWDPINAEKAVRSAIRMTEGGFDAVVASNDGTALGALKSLKAAGLAGKVAISGMDATAAGCNSIARGELSFTVLKDDRLLSPAVCEIAVKLAGNEDVPGLAPRKLSDFMLDDSYKGSFPSMFLPPILVDKANLKAVVADSGYQAYDAVYAGVENPPPR